MDGPLDWQSPSGGSPAYLGDAVFVWWFCPCSQKTRGPFSSSSSFHLRPFWYDGKEGGGSGSFGETFRVSNGTERWLCRRTTVLGSAFLCFIFNLVSVFPAHRMLEVVLVTHSQTMILYRKGRGIVIGKLGLILFVLIRVYGWNAWAWRNHWQAHHRGKKDFQLKAC